MSQFKKKITAFTAMLAFLSITGATAMAASVDDVINNTNNIGFSTSDNRLDVNVVGGQHGAVGQVDWNDFSVGKGEHVNFGFSGLSQTVINRVLGGKLSDIQGKITNSCINGGACDSYAATGKVILINPAGVMFGAGSMVDLNSFTVSTFDFKGAQNLRNMTESQMAAYQANVLNKLSPTPEVNGENRVHGSITFDSNYTDAFEEEGLSFNKGDTFVKLDGATFAHFNPDGTISESDPNKSLAIVSDNITYKDSLIRTGSNNNYVTSAGSQSFSNVRLITADGVTFDYLANGYLDTYKVAEDTASDVQRNITIDNSGLAPDQTAIQAGDVHIINKSNAEGSNIKISNSIIKGTKLINKENGDIMIVGSHDVLVDNSRLETVNTYAKDENGVMQSTEGQNGGEVFISADKDVTVKDSLVYTAGSKGQPEGSNAGKVRIFSYGGKATVDNSKVIANGDAAIQSTDKVEINDSLVKTQNTVDSNDITNIKISAADEVKIGTSIVNADGNINIRSEYSDNSLAGNIIITSDLDKNGQNQTLIAAGDKLSIQGSNTLIDNSSLVYDEIKFYNDGTTGLNNVTVANNSTFSPIGPDGKVSGDVTLETNGNFTLDNATMKRAAYSLKFDRNEDGSLVDDGTKDAINYKLTINTADANNLSVTSTEGDVNVVNTSNVHTNQDINLLSKKGDVKIDNSTLKADRNLKAEATKGGMFVKNDSNITGGNDVTLEAYESIVFGEKGAENINIDNSSKIASGSDMYITSTGGDIIGEKTTMPILEYGDRLTFNAKGDNIFTSEDSLKSVNVDYIAGGANKFYTQDDIQFVNSTFEAPENFIESGSDVIMNNLTIKQATANAKDTVTEIYANGDVTTDDVTGTAAQDVAEKTHKFPQSVSVDRNGTGKTVLDINKTKLKITTETVKDANDPTNGSIVLDVKNADNKDAGLELTAQNVAALDKDPTGGNFRPGYYLSGTQKWDENIAPSEGPEVHLNAEDDSLSISKIITDKLWLDKNDNMYAADADLTPEQMAGIPEGVDPKGYIEVRDEGGFNMDENKDYDPAPDGFEYEKNFDSQIIDKNVDTKTETTVGDAYVIDKDVDVDVKVEHKKDPDQTVTTTTTTTTTTYGKDTTTQDTTTTTTTIRDQKHTIKFDNNHPEGGDFILVYDKTTTDTDVEVKDPVTTTETWQDVDVDVKVEVEDCPEPPVVNPDDDNIDSLINQIKLPREQVEISKTSKVSDNTVDQTSNIMSAAAKVDLGQEEKSEEEDKEE